MKKSPVTAAATADYLIWFCHDSGDSLTNLKLQKLLYFAQCWYLVFNGEPLFDDEIQAWVYGPVVASIYQRFKRFKWNPITTNPDETDISKKVKEYLNEIVRLFAGYSSYELELMTHQEPPWQKARKGMPIHESSENVVNIDDMKTYYSGLRQQR